ncbi:hypothetical protein ACLB2K_041193 [Fragaria x ananassa]
MSGAGDEDKTKKYNDMVDEVNKRKEAFKEQHPDMTDEEIMESVQSQQIEVLEEHAQQQLQEVKQRALRAESIYSVVQSQVAAIYEHLGMPHPPHPQVSPQNNDDRGNFPRLDENASWHW